MRVHVHVHVCVCVHACVCVEGGGVGVGGECGGGDGVVWCGVVWCGVVWSGVEWSGVEWSGRVGGKGRGGREGGEGKHAQAHQDFIVLLGLTTMATRPCLQAERTSASPSNKVTLATQVSEESIFPDECAGLSTVR